MSAEQRRITLTEEDGWWVAKDESVGEHGVASQGRTRKEALDNLDEAVALHKGETGESVTDDDFREWGLEPEDIHSGGELPDVFK